MLRSIRVPLLASFVALMFYACGGGGGGGEPLPDGGQQDGQHIQFDAQKDGIIQQQDAQTDGGGGGSCVASGGVATFGICKASKPCTCPNDCVDPGLAGAAGACAPPADPNTGCTGTDQGIYVSDPNDAHCYPTTIMASGTFSVPIGTQATIGGTANMTLTLGGASFAVTQGWAQHNTTNSYWDLYFMPADATTAPVNWIRVIVADAEYNTTTPVNFDTSTTSVVFLYQDQSNARLAWGDSISGTLSLTTADTGSTGTAAGSFTNLKFYLFPMELCGPNTTGC